MPTVTRSPRMQGLPPITSGSRVIRSRVVIEAPLSTTATPTPVPARSAQLRPRGGPADGEGTQGSPNGIPSPAMNRSVSLSDLRGYSRLAVEATVGLTDLVETVHRSVTRLPRAGGATPGRTRGITGFVYRAVRLIAQAVGGGIDAALAQLAPIVESPAASAPPAPAVQREAAVAALNGVLGGSPRGDREPARHPHAVPARRPHPRRGTGEGRPGRPPRADQGVADSAGRAGASAPVETVARSRSGGGGAGEGAHLGVRDLAAGRRSGSRHSSRPGRRQSRSMTRSSYVAA